MHWETGYYFLKIKKTDIALDYMMCNQKWFKRIFTNNYKTDIVRRKSLEL